MVLVPSVSLPMGDSSLNARKRLIAFVLKPPLAFSASWMSSGYSWVTMSIEPPEELLGRPGAKVFATIRLLTTSDGKRSSWIDWRSGSGLGTGALLKVVLL